MPDWTAPSIPVPEEGISPYSTFSIGGCGTSLGGLGGAAWPAANRAIFVPFRVQRPLRVPRLWWNNGATVSGNADAGLYDQYGNRIVSTGSTAQAGASTIQAITLGSAPVLARGLYYMALALDNATGLIVRANGSVLAVYQVVGMAEMAAAFPLPATAVLASLSAQYMPNFGLFTRPTP